MAHSDALGPHAANTGQAYREKHSAAASSVVAALFLTGLKIAVGWLTGSLGILAEAAHSALDLIAAGVTLLAIRVSGKPADVEHPYGHGKVENLSALFETFLLLATCAWIVYEAVERLFVRTVDVEPSVPAFLVMFISIAVDYSRSRMLMRAAVKHNSQALEADALHFSTDIWSSAVVIVGLACVVAARAFRAPWLAQADVLAALGVSVIVVWISLRLGRRTVLALLDGVSAGLGDDLARAVNVPGVVEVRRVRARRAGADTFADVVLTVDPNASIGDAHGVACRAEEAARALLPGADVIVHVEPSDRVDDSTFGAVRRVAGEHDLNVHDIRLTDVLGRRAVGMHVELDGRTDVSAAHSRVTAFEQALEAELPGLVRIVTHLEPLEGSAVEPAAVDQDRVAAVVAEVAGSQPLRCEAHDILVTSEEGETALTFHCSVSGDIPLDSAHRVTDRMERAIRDRLPGVDRVTIHVEPV